MGAEEGGFPGAPPGVIAVTAASPAAAGRPAPPQGARPAAGRRRGEVGLPGGHGTHTVAVQPANLAAFMPTASAANRASTR